MLSKVLVANRGEIAARVIRTCAEMGIATVAVHSDADKDALHVRLADEAVHLPGVSAADTYLNQQALLQACRTTGADAVHPGYGFLSENSDFCRLLHEAGIVFIGPSADAISQLGDKVRAREIAIEAGVPVVQGSTGSVDNGDDVRAFGAKFGWPVAVKAVHGGGGRGMRVVRSPAEADALLASARAEAQAAFGKGLMYLERYLEKARHVEVQIFGDTHGNLLWLGDRDCSVQRLHQKILEEAPAPSLSAAMRQQMGEASVRLGRHVGYVGAGTVEFLVAGDAFYFLEVNTRIQVEHPVSELVMGVDLVREQLIVAGGGRLTLQPGQAPRGHAIECRVNAEDPTQSFRPGPGLIRTLKLPSRAGIRFDTGYEEKDTVPPYYDSLIGKIIAWAPTRALAIRRLESALRSACFVGVPTTLGLVGRVLSHPDMQEGAVHTRWLEEHLQELLRDLPASDAAGPAADAPATGPTTTEVWIDGARYQIPPAPLRVGLQAGSARTSAGAPGRSGRAASGAAASGRILSAMHGTVISVAVQPGQQVETGDVLLTIEAMKMENVVAAPCSGRVDEVRVKLGDAVHADQHLVTLLPTISVG